MDTFLIKLYARCLQLYHIATPTQVLFSGFWEILKKTYFINICKGLLKKSKVFVGTSFCRASDFYHKRKRQLFYSERTLQCFPVKILRHVNKVVFKNSFERLPLKIPLETKPRSKSRRNNTSSMSLYSNSGAFTIALELIEAEASSGT